MYLLNFHILLDELIEKDGNNIVKEVGNWKMVWWVPATYFVCEK